MQTIVRKCQYIIHYWKRALWSWVLYVQHSLWNHLKHYLWVRSMGCQKMCCVEKMNKGVKKKHPKQTRTVCGMYYTREYVFSWDIWRYQQELLYWCCDKWLYSQFTFFCFLVLLECSLACSSPCVYFCHFSLLLSRKFPHFIFSHVGEHAHTETIINQVRNNQTSIKVTFMSTSIWVREKTTLKRCIRLQL